MRLVSVIIPMFNAEATIERTLASVSRQTHSNLEVLVVDDGSTDGSAGIVDAFCEKDRRFRRLAKQNGGVASARNHGINRAKADYVGLIDADDLWHPQFVEKTLAALMLGGEQYSFAYALNRRIDVNDKVIGNAPLYGCEGKVLCQNTFVNFVGNGSATLMRRKCVIDCGGFDETLHARGAQGCEDWLMQMRLAENHLVAQVPEYLVGYRQIPGQMSENCKEMSLSLDLVLEEMKRRCPWLPDAAIKWTKARSENWRLLDAIRRRDLIDSLHSALLAFLYDPRATLGESMPKFLTMLLRAANLCVRQLDQSELQFAAGGTFEEFSPRQNVSSAGAGIQARRLLWLRELDQTSIAPPVSVILARSKFRSFLTHLARVYWFLTRRLGSEFADPRPGRNSS